MMLLQLGDLHIGADWVGLDPLKTLAATVDAIRRLGLGIEAVLALGDLTEHGTGAEYDAARAGLEALGAPIYPAMGNRDDRQTLRRHFGLVPESDAPVRYATDLGSVRLVVLDTTIPGEDAGHLDPDSLAWLHRECSGHPNTPILLAMHHPPLLTRSPAWDRIALSAEGRTGLAQLLDAHPQIRGILGAHLHRPLFVEFASRPVIVGPSTYVQFPMNLDAVTLDPADEPPGYVVHLIAEEARLISSVQTVPAPGRRSAEL